MEYRTHQLNNGIRIIHRYLNSEVSHCGLMVDTGTREENTNESGMAHFIEHLIFKGTKKRKAYHVLSRLENLGGELNAYTTKEETCIYASFLSPYYAHSLELFADLAFQSVYPKKEIEKEKEVVIDEINSYNDNPAELIYDEFENQIFEGHPLGRNILGDIERIKLFERADVLRFVRRNYSADQMVVASVGRIDFTKLCKLVDRYFGSVRPLGKRASREPFLHYTQRQISCQKDSYLTHSMIGNVAYSRNHPQKLTLLLLNNLLGGPVLNSRLNLAIREKYGYAYSIESMYQPYSDTGVFGIYLGTDKQYHEKSIALVMAELKKLRDRKLGTVQLHRAKRQIIGQMAINFESSLNEMLGIAQAHLNHTEVKSLDLMIRELEQLTADDLQEVAQEIFNPEQLSIRTFKGK